MIISVAHNAAFDVAILRREGIKPRNIICTYKVASAIDTEERFSHYSLQYLRYALGIEIEANAHDAIGDVLVLEALFEYLLAKLTDAARLGRSRDQGNARYFLASPNSSRPSVSASTKASASKRSPAKTAAIWSGC